MAATEDVDAHELASEDASAEAMETSGSGDSKLTDSSRLSESPLEQSTTTTSLETLPPQQQENQEENN